MWKYILTEKAIGSLKKIDIQNRTRIFKKMDFFVMQENPLFFAEKLKNSLYGEYRFRVGDYRILFDVDQTGKIIIIAVVGHRRKIYK